MIETIYPYIDLIWLPAGLLVIHKKQRLWAAGFFIGSMIMMRLLVDLIESIGYPQGILPVLDAPLFTRGLVVYSAFYAFYILLAAISPKSIAPVFIAASISIFFMASITAVIVMIL